ncbi:MAG: alpha amylase catalytic region [Gemmatimonadetes bacterium]|nr:alpha amylase catalytic region [Gemmatimonadota bacterium]
MRHPIRSLVALLALGACSAATTMQQAGPPQVGHPQWSRNASIYEINVRQYTPSGSFTALTKELPRIAGLGVDMVWLMPVQPIGVERRKGPLGSYYSVSNYTAINPEYGNAADFRAFVTEAHRVGLRVLLDWVPNHTSFDHAWIKQHPDWYVHHADGTISNARDDHDRETDWTDVAELNYDNQAMRAEMIAEMRWWLTEMKLDGFRCDVAGGVPMDFWVDARKQLAATKPDIFMLAEAEGPQFHSAFDMTYGWEFHHMLNEISKGNMPTSEIDAYLARQATAYPADAYRMYFTSNHDENSWNGTEFERMGANHVPSFILAATLRNSMPLIYTGQEASFNRRLRFFDKDTVDFTGASLANWYTSVMALKHGNAALANGSAGGAELPLATNGGTRVYAFTRSAGSNTVLVMVNFGDASKSVSYSALSAPGTYRDWFSSGAVSLGASGLVDVPAHGYRVLVK